MLGCVRRRRHHRLDGDGLGLRGRFVARARTGVSSDVVASTFVTTAAAPATAATSARWVAVSAIAGTRRCVGSGTWQGVDKVLRCGCGLVGRRRGTGLALGARPATAAFRALAARRACRIRGWCGIRTHRGLGAGGLRVAAAAVTLTRRFAARFTSSFTSSFTSGFTSGFTSTLAAATVAAALAWAFATTFSRPILAAVAATTTFASIASLTASATLG